MADQWEQKYRRESWTFPFGSMLAAYSQTIKGQDKSPEEIISASNKFFTASQELMDKSIDNVKKVKEGTIPNQ